mgnify:FL=1
MDSQKEELRRAQAKEHEEAMRALDERRKGAAADEANQALKEAKEASTHLEIMKERHAQDLKKMEQFLPPVC